MCELGVKVKNRFSSLELRFGDTGTSPNLIRTATPDYRTPEELANTD
jgi:hypothetical protein